jgi:ribosomal protein L37AE/L43A
VTAVIEPELACPFCGSRRLETARWYKRGTWFVRCEDCAATGPSLAKSEEEAVRLFDIRRDAMQGRLEL